MITKLSFRVIALPRSKRISQFESPHSFQRTSKKLLTKRGWSYLENKFTCTKQTHDVSSVKTLWIRDLIWRATFTRHLLLWSLHQILFIVLALDIIHSQGCHEQKFWRQFKACYLTKTLLSWRVRDHRRPCVIGFLRNWSLSLLWDLNVNNDQIIIKQLKDLTSRALSNPSLSYYKGTHERTKY